MFDDFEEFCALASDVMQILKQLQVMGLQWVRDDEHFLTTGSSHSAEDTIDSSRHGFTNDEGVGSR